MQTFRLKPGRGKHTYRTAEGRVVLKGGDTITCEPEELGGAIDKFDAIDQPIEIPTAELIVAQTEDGYFVATAEGKAIHQGPVSREDAVKLAGEAEVVKAEEYYSEFDGLDTEEEPEEGAEVSQTAEAAEEGQAEAGAAEQPTKPKRKKGKGKRR